VNKHLLISAQRLCEAADCGEDGELPAGCDFHISALQPPAPNKHDSPMDKRLIINFQKGRGRGGGERSRRAVARRGDTQQSLGSAPRGRHPRGFDGTSRASAWGTKDGDGDEDGDEDEDGNGSVCAQ